MLIKRILSRENLLLALKRVEKNKGAHGVDNMPVQNLRAHILEHWETLKTELLTGNLSTVACPQSRNPET